MMDKIPDSSHMIRELFIINDRVFITIARYPWYQGVIESFYMTNFARISPDRLVSLARENFFIGGLKSCIVQGILSVNC